MTGSRRHAVRRRAEMEAAVAMLEELGVTPRVAAASEAWLGELAAARRRGATPTSTAAPSSAAGYGGPGSASRGRT